MKKEKNKTKRGTYEVWFTCPNCNMGFVHEFDKGVPARYYGPCPHCEVQIVVPNITDGCYGVQG
jgi:transcription elongation factor Elf1